jgi:anti-anti-sigma regulatory factor
VGVSGDACGNSGPDSAGSVAVFQHGRSSMVVLAGAFDVFDAINFKASLDIILGCSAPDVLIDASKVSEIDITFLGVLVALERACTEFGGRCMIIGSSVAPPTTGGLAGLDRLLDPAGGPSMSPTGTATDPQP